MSKVILDICTYAVAFSFHTDRDRTGTSYLILIQALSEDGARDEARAHLNADVADDVFVTDCEIINLTHMGLGR